ncbi:MAG TPA: APC family permease [Gammaproteobacteria bacterium]|nr:APC family permease [Gammaproteobacteria bacterium]
MTTHKIAGISVFALVMLISGAVDSIRNLPATALFGSSLIFFLIFSAVIFLVPVALVSAELASGSAEKSGIFHWACHALGEKTGFLAIWLQWISNLVWFPTSLSFIAGTATYLLSPGLAQNRMYLISMILGTFWLLTFLNLRGVKVSARFTTFCAITGLVIPMTLLITLAAIWVFQGQLLQIHFTAANLVPKWHDSQSWISLTAIMTAFLGIELAAVHAKDVANPQKAYPVALFFSVLLILGTMIFASLSIAIVLPKNQINLVNGALQAFSHFFAAYHIPWVMPVITLLIIVGVAGSMISWVISPVRGLVQAAQLNYLPAFLQKENKYGVASHLLITQAVLVSLFCLGFLLMPSVNGSYWLLTALSTQLYILMYIILFVAALVLRYRHPDRKQSFKVPFGKTGLWVVSLLGLTGCAITEIVGFIPPEGINVGSLAHYETVFVLGMAIMILPVLGCYALQKRKRSTHSGG